MMVFTTMVATMVMATLALEMRPRRWLLLLRPRDGVNAGGNCSLSASAWRMRTPGDFLEAIASSLRFRMEALELM